MSERTEKLAINLFDLDRLPEDMRGSLLGGRLDTGTVVTIDRNKVDEKAVIFVCTLLDAAQVCDIIRLVDLKAQDSITRVYLKRSLVWIKLSSTQLLTVVQNGKSVLNPELFPTPVELAKPVPLEARKVL